MTPRSSGLEGLVSRSKVRGEKFEAMAPVKEVVEGPTFHRGPPLGGAVVEEVTHKARGNGPSQGTRY